jgi:site-specific recombinase XerD
VAATTLLQAGVPMPVVSRILGHSSIQITVDTYGHLTIDSALHDQVDRALSGFAR